MEEERLNKLPEGWVIIRHQKAADTLIDPNKYRYLLPFFAQARSLSEAAKIAGIKSNLMHYHVKRFLEFCLLNHVATKQGRGRASKLYQASAKKFFIPLEHTSLATMEAVLYQLQEPALQATIRSRVRLAARDHDDLGMGFEFHDGQFNIFLRPLTHDTWADHESLASETSPAVFSKFLIAFPLEAETAKWVQRELIDLYERVSAKVKPGARRYTIGFSIAPTDQV